MRAINLRPSGSLRLVLALLPFLALLLAYIIGSHIRLAENPNDKLLPSLADMAWNSIDTTVDAFDAVSGLLGARRPAR